MAKFKDRDAVIIPVKNEDPQEPPIDITINTAAVIAVYGSFIITAQPKYIESTLDEAAILDILTTP